MTTAPDGAIAAVAAAGNVTDPADRHDDRTPLLTTFRVK